MFGISLPNPMDAMGDLGNLVPGVGSDKEEPETEGQEFTDEVLTALEVLEEGFNKLSMFKEAEDVTAASEEELLQIEAQLQEDPKADLDLNRVFDFMIHKAFNTAFNAMHPGNQQRARKLLSFFAEVLQHHYKCNTSALPLFKAAAEALLSKCEPAKTWNMTVTELSKLAAALISNFKLVSKDKEGDAPSAIALSDCLTSSDFDPEVNTDFQSMLTHHSIPDAVGEEGQTDLETLAEAFVTSQEPAESKSQQAYVMNRLKTFDSGASASNVVRKAEYDRLDRQLMENRTHTDAIELREAKLKRELSGAIKEKERMQEELSGWYSLVTELKPKVVMLESECELAKSQGANKVQAAEHQASMLKEKCASLEERLEELSSIGDSKKNIKDAILDDAKMELQASIMESEGLYAQLDVLQKQVDELTAANENILTKHAQDSGHAQTQEFEIKRLSEVNSQMEAEVEKIKAQYEHSRGETRMYCTENENLLRHNHDLKCDIALLRAEMVLCASHITETEREGLDHFKQAKPEILHEATEAGRAISEICQFAVSHRNKVDAESKEAKQQIQSVTDSLQELEAKNKSLSNELEAMRIELAHAKHGRNQFLLLSRNLKAQLEEQKKESENSYDKVMQDMKFYSDQYDSLNVVKAKEGQRMTSSDEYIQSVTNKAADLEESSNQWAGLGCEIQKFMDH